MAAPMAARPAALAPLSQITPISVRVGSSPVSVTGTPRKTRDAPVLAELIELHVVTRPVIVDCTYGHGGIWGHLPIRQSVVKVDINPALPNLDLVADWRELPRHYASGSVDCLVWDPIQVSDVGHNSQFYGQFVAPQAPVKGPSVNQLYPSFFDVADQLVRSKTGVCLVKMIDQVHSGRQQWQVLELVAEAQRRGWTACDYSLIWSAKKVDPKHRNRFHVRNQWVYWLVFRHGPACRGSGVRLKHELICTVCGAKFAAARSDARTCPGGRCRQRRRRAHRKACS